MVNISDLDISSENSSLSSIDSSQKQRLTIIDARKRAGGVKIVGQSSDYNFYTDQNRYLKPPG